MKTILRKLLIFICRARQQFLVSNKFEGKNRVALTTKIKNCTLGVGTYIGSNGKFYNTKIGKFCCIGSNVRTVLATHPTHYISMHPAFYSTDLQSGFTFVKEKKFNDILPEIKIGSDVWIGSGVSILGGISIGDGTVIGTGSIVTKNVPSYEIWGGIPAKKIRDRFSEEDKNYIEKIKWWDKDLNWIKENKDLFLEIENLDRNFFN